MQTARPVCSFSAASYFPKLGWREVALVALLASAALLSRACSRARDTRGEEAMEALHSSLIRHDHPHSLTVESRVCFSWLV